MFMCSNLFNRSYCLRACSRSPSWQFLTFLDTHYVMRDTMPVVLEAMKLNSSFFRTNFKLLSPCGLRMPGYYIVLFGRIWIARSTLLWRLSYKKIKMTDRPTSKCTFGSHVRPISFENVVLSSIVLLNYTFLLIFLFGGKKSNINLDCTLFKRGQKFILV